MTSNIDPAIVLALRTLAGDGGESARVASVRKKHVEQSKDKLETQMELLSDELERVIPRDHKLFQFVLLLAVMFKIEKQQAEPEYKSALEVFPPGW